MPTYIALLRGINVAGQKKIKMAELKEMFSKMGYSNVVTYIQSGNVIFDTKKTKFATLENNIKTAILNTFTFDVPVLVTDHKELTDIEQNNPYRNRAVESKFLYFTLLAEAPDSTFIKKTQDLTFPGEAFYITPRVVYICVPNGYGRTKISNNFFESKLKVSATTRNLKTLSKLIELSKSD